MAKPPLDPVRYKREEALHRKGNKVIIGGRKPVSPKPAELIGPEAERRSHLRGGPAREG